MALFVAARKVNVILFSYTFLLAPQISTKFSFRGAHRICKLARIQYKVSTVVPLTSCCRWRPVTTSFTHNNYSKSGGYYIFIFAV